MATFIDKCDANLVMRHNLQHSLQAIVKMLRQKRFKLLSCFGEFDGGDDKF